jgi:hypothetical protein
MILRNALNGASQAEVLESIGKRMKVMWPPLSSPNNYRVKFHSIEDSDKYLVQIDISPSYRTIVCSNPPECYRLENNRVCVVSPRILAGFNFEEP